MWSSRLLDAFHRDRRSHFEFFCRLLSKVAFFIKTILIGIIMKIKSSTVTGCSSPECEIATGKRQNDLRFMELCCNMKIEPFDGNPRNLESFIHSMTILESLATNDNKELLRSFILSKLVGNACDAVTVNNGTIEDIKTSLRQSVISNESVDLIKAKMMTLSKMRCDDLNFVKKGKKLATSLYFTFIKDGIPPIKAKSFVVDCVTEMCINKTQSDYVKLLMETLITDDVNVIFAKFLTASNKSRNEDEIKSSKQKRNFQSKSISRKSHDKNNDHMDDSKAKDDCNKSSKLNSSKKSKRQANKVSARKSQVKSQIQTIPMNVTNEKPLQEKSLPIKSQRSTENVSMNEKPLSTNSQQSTKIVSKRQNNVNSQQKSNSSQPESDVKKKSKKSQSSKRKRKRNKVNSTSVKNEECVSVTNIDQSESTKPENDLEIRITDSKSENVVSNVISENFVDSTQPESSNDENEIVNFERNVDFDQDVENDPFDFGDDFFTVKTKESKEDRWFAAYEKRRLCELQDDELLIEQMVKFEQN